MQTEKIYDNLFTQALQQIKCVRNPHATKPESVDLSWNIIRDNVIFDFSGHEYEKYTNVVVNAKNISITCLHYIILELVKKYNCDLESTKVKVANGPQSIIQFSLKDSQNDCLLIFKEIEESSFWKLKDNEPDEIRVILENEGISKCKYVYLVRDYAYLQIISHNDDVTDPGRGYNVYSLKWFFDEYFEESEWKLFITKMEKFTEDVKEYIGYIILKSLSPNTLINFRRVTENILLKYNYKSLLQKEVKGKVDIYKLTENAYESLIDQYIDQKCYLAMIGNNDYAESFLTAEWLYSSMKSAKAIDLTVIGMGYFKALEQLLFDLVCLHRNEDRYIKAKNSTNRKSRNEIILNDINIDNENIDISLGAMANFYKDNLDILRVDFGNSKRYILEKIFEYTRIRNGYFHKHNIHNWDVVEEIRNTSFELICLLLGSQNISIEDKLKMDISANSTIFDDFYKLCEFVNYHSNEVFFLRFSDGSEHMMIAYADLYTEVINEKYVSYSGLYFKEWADNGRIIKFTKEQLPSEIFSGKITFANDEKIKFEPVKVQKIYEDGKFVGPSIVEEEKFSY